MSADGRFVAFWGGSTNLVGGDTNLCQDCFVRDRLAGTIERISISTSGIQGNSHSRWPVISDDGRYVAFMSLSSNLVAGDLNGTWDVFVRDRILGTTVIASLDSNGVQGNAASESSGVMSGDGRYVTFDSLASNLVPNDTNACRDAFVHDAVTGVTERVSVSSNGIQGNGDSFPIAVSNDGRFVAFRSLATNLVPGDTNAVSDLFVRDRASGTTERIDVSTGGAQANGATVGGTISPDGRFVVFSSDANNLVPGDSNSTYDVFVRDRLASGFTSACDPGNAGVIACPCANPPSSSGRGCDNSSATGGASLSAAGVAYLSNDTLAFTTSGEKASAPSLLLQGNAEVSGGTPFGQGIRCVGGTLKRLFAKTAGNGSVTAPDFGAGDAPVSSRSAALGMPLQPGQPYYYLVYYRDPIVLGGCSSFATFNCTQTGVIAFWP